MALYEINPNAMRGSGTYFLGRAGEALGRGKLVFKHANGAWYLADADLVAEMPVIGLTMDRVNAGQIVRVMKEGFLGRADWAWTVGTEMYASSTPGELVQVAAGISQIVGMATQPNLIYFEPEGTGGAGVVCALLEGHTAYVGFDACKGAAYTNYFICDGTADDVQIQAAIDYVEALVHDEGSIFLESGIYDITARLTVSDPNITLHGAGVGTQLILANNTDNNILRTLAAATGFTLKNIYFDGNGGNQGVANVTIVAIRSDDSKVMFCEFYDGCNSGFAFDAVSNCRAEENYSHDNAAEGCGVVSLTGASTDIWFVNNTCENNGTEGIIVSDAGGNGVNKIHIIGNRLIGNTNKGIQISNGADEVIVMDNISTGNDIGINAIGSTDLRDSTDIQIIGNHCEGNTGTTGIGLSRVERFVVGDNIIKTHGGANARSIYVLGCTKGEIHDNVCEDHAAAGIQITDSGVLTSTYIDVHNNYVDGGTYGLLEGGSSDYNEYFNNTILNAATAPAQIVGANTKLPELFAAVSDPDGLIGYHPAATMPDLADTSIYTQIALPLSFHQVIFAQAIVVALASGNMRRNVNTDFGKLCSSEDYDTHTGTVATAQVALTINDLECVDIKTAFTGATAGDLVGIQFNRIGTNVLDTIGDSVYYLGIKVRYV